MVQAKAKSQGNPIKRALAQLRAPRLFIPWLSQSFRRFRLDSVVSALSSLREVRMNRRRYRPPERQGPQFEILEPRILMSGSIMSGFSYDLINANSGMAAIVVSATPGTIVTQQANTSAQAEEWKFTSIGSGDYDIVNNSSTLALGVTDGSMAAGAAVDEETYTGAASQQWALTSANGGYVITNVASGLALDVANSSITAGAQLIQNTADGAASQTWQLQALPSGWGDQDIGSPTLAGSADFDGTTWTVSGGGADIWNYSDQFNFASESFTGDGQIIAQVNSQTDTNISAKAGVMFRNTGDSASAFADVIVTPADGVEFQWRGQSYASCSSAKVTGVTTPIWVKLMRVGNNFSGYYSTDGLTWTQLGQPQYIAMNTSALAGLAVTAHDNSALSTATFTNVSLGSAATAPGAVTNLTASDSGAAQIRLSWTDPNTYSDETDLLIQRSIDGVNFATVSTVPQGTTSYTDNALSGSTTYYYRVVAENAGNLAAASNSVSAVTAAASLPAPWNTTSVGTTASSSYTAGEGLFTLQTLGNIAPDSHSAYYIGAGIDSFGYVYQPLGTNGQIVAEVIGHADTGPWGKAGLMVRANGDADAAFAGIFITPGYGVVMLSRSAAGNIVTDPGYDNGYSLAGEGTLWLKLTMENGVISGYISTDGVNWSLVGQVSGVTLGAVPVVGLAADSGGTGSGSTAWFTHVSVGAITDPTLVPEMPYYLQAEAFSAVDGRITWAALQDATSFNVQQSTDNGQTWSLVASGGSATSDTFLPDNLTGNTTYRFRVQAVGSEGDSPYSQAVSMTTGTTPSWTNYFAEAPGLGPISSGLDTTFSLSSTNATVYAPSWQNAMLTQLSGSVGVPQLGINYTIGDFSTATTGNGDFGASGVLLMPSLSANSAEMGVNNNYADLRSNPNQNDNPPTGSINELENAPGDQGVVFNQKEAENMDQGGYLLLNSNDYDYRLTSGNALIPASSQTNLTVADPALQQVQINAENPTSAGGIYTLTTTGGLQLWLNDQKEGQITSSYDFSAANPSPDIVYVEGTQTGEGSIMLNWQKNTNAAPQLMDTVYYNVWQITGPQNVPGKGKYTYSVQLPTKISADGADWSVPNSADVPVTQANPANIAVVWSAGPEVGSVDYSPVIGFIGQWNVNVVEISVTSGSTLGSTNVPGTAATLTNQFNTGEETAYVPGNLQTYHGSFNGQSTTINVAQVTFDNTVNMSGPNGGWGDLFMRIGYIQNVTVNSYNATYSSNGNNFTLTASLQGNSYLDASNNSKLPWMQSNDGGGYFPYWGSKTSLSNRSVALTNWDSPYVGIPATSPANTAGDPVGAALTAFDVSYSFTTYIAVETVDPETQPAYVKLAYFSWQTNYSASTVNGSLQIAAGSGFSPAGAGAFTLATPGSFVPITSGQTANQAGNSITWS